MKRWVAEAMIAIPALFLMIFAAGCLLPKSHQTTYRLTLEVPPEKVWQTLEETLPKPDRAIASAGNDKMVWTEQGRLGVRRWRVLQKKVPTSLVLSTIDSELFDRITRTIDLTARDGGGTEIRATQKTDLINPLFRVYARITHAREKSLEKYLGGLANSTR